jgi:hypothetical protein
MLMIMDDNQGAPEACDIFRGQAAVSGTYKRQILDNYR